MGVKPHSTIRTPRASTTQQRVPKTPPPPQPNTMPRLPAFQPRRRQPSILQTVIDQSLADAPSTSNNPSSPLPSPPPPSPPSSSIATTSPAKPPPTPSSPTRREDGKSKRAHPTTAALRSLLPRRRGVATSASVSARKEAFRIHSSPLARSEEDEDEEDGDGEEEDEDELQRPAKRRRRGAPGNEKGRVRKGGVGIARTARGKGRRRRGVEDKENAVVKAVDGDGEDGEGDGGVDRDGVAGQTSGAGGELVAAKEKFREVDEWELEFESGDLAGANSSPWR